MMLASKKQKYSLEEYFELERTSEEKFEFWDGNVWSMSGASPVHERIVINAGGHFRDIFRGRGCSVFGSNLKVKVPDYQPYSYPDLTIYCGEGMFETMGGLEVLTNPQLIIEVLSPSTEAFDRGEKFTYYKSIPSLTDYLLIGTLRPHVTLFTKQSKNEWLHREAVGLGEKLKIKNLGVEILLSEIYLDIEFPDPPVNLFLVDQ